MEQTAKNSLYFLIATIIGKASGLVLIPLYLLVLSPGEAGLWAVLAIFRTIVASGATLAIDGYLTQEYWHRSETNRDSLCASCLTTVTRWNTAAACAAMLLLFWEPAQIWVLTFIGAQATGILAVRLAQYRIKEQARIYCVMACISGGGSALLAAALAIAGMGVVGIAIGFALPPVIMACSRPTFSSTPDAHATMAPYVRRILPARLLSELIGQTDRLMVGALLGGVQLGLYDLAARCAGIVGMVLSSAKQAVLPAVLKSLATGEDDRAPWATWFHASMVAIGMMVALLALGWFACLVAPEHPWSPALPYLPGALAISLWTHASLGNAAAIYHHRLTRLQAILPPTTLLLMLAGTWLGSRVSSLGVAWGAAVSLLLVVAVTARYLQTTKFEVATGRRDLLAPLFATGLLIAFTIVLSQQ